MNRRTFRILLAVGVILGAMSGIVLAVTLSNSVQTSGTIPLGHPDGADVFVHGGATMDLSDFTEPDRLILNTTDGNFSAYSNGATELHVHPGTNMTGTWTNVTQVTAGGTWIEVYPVDKPRIDVRGDVNAFSLSDSYEVDDGEIDAYYEGTDGGTVSAKFYGLVPDTDIVAIDPNTNLILDQQQTDANGDVTLNMPSSSHSVELQTYSAAAPTLSNPQPEGLLQSEPSQISIDVEDDEFSQGDSVTVTFTLDGTQIDQQTVSSPGTVSTSVPSDGQTGGQHTVEVEAEDSYGSTDVESWTYSVPSVLSIRNESNPDDLTIAEVSYSITFFGDEGTIRREGSTVGNISLDGYPVNEQFIVEINPENESWTDRAVYIDSIYEQQNAYLLNKSEYDIIESRFILSDPTGQYDSSSVVSIQRGLNQSGNLRWRTVHGDRFGAEGVQTELQEDVRYRVVVENTQGESQTVGPYRADLNETVTVEPGAPSIDLGDFEEGYSAVATLNNQTVEWRYSDPKELTDTLKVFIHEKGDPDNLLTPNSTFTNLGNVSQTFQITGNESQKTWEVEFIVDRNGGEFTVVRPISNMANLFNALGENWQVIIGVGSLIMLAGAFSMLNAAVGAVVVSLVGGLLWWIGLLSGVTSALAIAVAIFVSVINHIRKSGGP